MNTTQIQERLVPYPVTTINIQKLEGYGSHNFLVEDDAGNRYVFKYYEDPSHLDLLRAESKLLIHANEQLAINVSTPVFFDMPYQYADGTFSRMLRFLDGSFIADTDHTPELLMDFGEKGGLLDKVLQGYEDPVIKSVRHHWDLSRCLEVWDYARYIKDASQRKLVDYYFDLYRHHVQPKQPGLRHSIIHNDLNDWNVIAEANKVTGIIDFGDMCYAPLINELAVGLTYMMLSKADPIDVASKVIAGYHAQLALNENELRLLPYLIPARLCQSVCHSARKKAESADTEYILVSEQPAWDLLERWPGFSPDQLADRFLTAAGYSSKRRTHTPTIVQGRKKHLGPSLSTSYNQPIHMTGAAFQYMYDVNGNTYLDAYNNIPHVGHCHPAVSEAISRQTRKLNTNTRYLFRSITDYAEKLLSYFPEKLNKVFFVNSGSAASDLAVRMARNYTQRQHMLVLEDGYHGNTQQAIELSAYKFEGAGGKGLPQSVTKLPLPKQYHGLFNTGEEYAEDARDRIIDLIKHGTVPAAFIAEPISGCGGQVPLADGYLKGFKPVLDENSILTIMDEVQVGFGRVGTHFWAHEQLEILPDMVILGKPMGNGHPIGAVVTTTEIAEAFDNGMEFFSSFGGNPVSMEVGLAVLKVLEVEGLQQNARQVGGYFEQCAQAIASDYPWIGDIRCRGLFLGIEFTDPDSSKPATNYARMVKNAMRERLILTSTDGHYDNVLKMKPPLCFNKKNVDHFFDVFVQIMKSLTG